MLGPQELVFVDTQKESNSRNKESLGKVSAICQFNMGYRGGQMRFGLKEALRYWPWLQRRDNPNVFFVERLHGYTELHAMLTTVLPDDVLACYNLKREGGNFWLSPVMAPGMTDGTDITPWGKGSAATWCRDYAIRVEAAFEEFIWTQLCSNSRLNRSAFAQDSSLRLLAGDVRYWMHRLYQIAVSRNNLFCVVEKEDKEWHPLEELERKILANVPEKERAKYQVSRPYYGGQLWDGDDPEERQHVLASLVEGNETLDSIEPVIEVLLSHHTNEDFSKNWSWVKEDFERTFYHKRSRVKVALIETVDDRPVWDSRESCELDDAVFRDTLSFFNPRDQKLVIALRHGKSVGEMASDLGLRGHGAVSRRLARIKNRLRVLLKR